MKLASISSLANVLTAAIPLLHLASCSPMNPSNNSINHANSKRGRLQHDCTGSKAKALSDALRYCAFMADWAAGMALKEDRNFIRIFKNGDTATRKQVHDRFMKVSKECGDVGAGKVRFYCSGEAKKDNPCLHSAIAYDVSCVEPRCPADVYLCDGFFEMGPLPMPGQCIGNDQMSAIVTVVGQLDALFSPRLGTDDHAGEMKWEDTIALSADRAIMHTDSYGFFLVWSMLNCDV